MTIADQIVSKRCENASLKTRRIKKTQTAGNVIIVPDTIEQLYWIINFKLQSLSLLVLLG